MTTSMYQELRGFIEENFDEFAEYLTKGSSAPPLKRATERAGEILEELGEAIDFGYCLQSEEESFF